MAWKSGSVRRIRNNFSSFEEVELLIQIFLFITVLPLLIRFLSVPKLMELITPRDLKVYENLGQERAKDRVIKFTDYILGHNFWVYKAVCLKRSLVLYHFLRKLGIDVHVCFGVRLPDRGAKNKLEGHAWLQLCNGDIFLERDVEMTKTYKMTYCYPDLREQMA